MSNIRKTDLMTGKSRVMICCIYSVSFCILASLLFWKCRYGFPFEESFYVNTAYRFVKGDMPIIHEWHMSQLSFIYLEPVVALYLKIKGSTEGIMLFMRYAFTLSWSIFALFVFLRLRKISLPAASAVSIILLMYTPAGQMALYYNSIGIMTLLASCLILATAEKAKPFQYSAAGVLYAIAVTCCPFLAVLFVSVIILLIRDIVRKKIRGSIWMWTSLGVLVMFIAFCAVFIVRAPLADYLDMIPVILNDSEHDWNILDKIVDYFRSGMEVMIPCGLLTVMMVIIILLACLKKDSKSRRYGLLAFCILTVSMQLCFALLNNLINYYMFAPMLLGLYCFICLRDEINRRLFFFVWIPGFVYTVCLHLSSNMRFVAISSAASVATAAGLVMAVRYGIYLAGKETEKKTKRMLTAAVAAVILLQFGLVAERRIRYVFGAQDIALTTEKLDSGIAAGMYETPEWKDIYETKLKVTDELKREDIGGVLIVSSEWWMYLETEKDFAVYTTWTPNLNPSTLDRYYDLYPDRRPDAIYVDPNYAELVPQFGLQHYSGDQTADGGYILYPCES
ncbi:MAG: hypothetical protein IKE53_03270 [Clostridiales bacterium]|nr:hypothetical protein [Clostridiales bacterium]